MASASARRRSRSSTGLTTTVCVSSFISPASRIMEINRSFGCLRISAIRRSRSGPFWIFVADIGHSRHEAHVARDLEARDRARRRSRSARPRTPCCPARSSTNTAGTSSSARIGDADGLHELDRGVRREQRLDLGRGDVLAADLEHVLEAAEEDQAPVRRRARRGRRCGTSRRRRTRPRSSPGRWRSRRRARSRAPGSRRRPRSAPPSRAAGRRRCSRAPRGRRRAGSR